MAEAPDPNLLQDFLTESGELIEQFDADLVKLEAEPGSQPLLDQIFRALHTIKGAASFLNLDNLTRFAHAAEDALNKLRKGEVKVDQKVMDAMLRSVDVLRGQLAQLADGEAAGPGPEDLIQTLHEIAGSAAAGPVSPTSPATAPAPVAAAPVRLQDALVSAAKTRPLSFPPEKADLLSFMVSDLLESAKQIAPAAELLQDAATRTDGAAKLRELVDSMQPVSDYYELPQLNRLISMLAAAGAALGQCPDAIIGEAVVRIHAIALLLVPYAEALSASRELTWNLDTFESRFGDVCCGQSLPTELAGAHAGNPANVLRLDGVILAESVIGSTGTDSASDAEAAPPAPETAGNEGAARESDKASVGAGAHAEQTVRVEVSRLEALLNLVGEMVLTKNQILGKTRALRDLDLPHDVMESMAGVVGDLDRLTAELQVGVMRTRMQPLGKLFGRYPRIVRDLARKTGKEIRLDIEGGDTEVDKSVLELLGDPLVHMLRNSVDHGLENPEGRAAAGKPSTGSIKLSAEHQGGHVLVVIRDDGRGIDRDKVVSKAVERGLITAEAGAQMPDSEAFRLIFAPGLSTADQVSDLSGRGVGMDVVNTNIAKLGGSVNVRSVKGKGTEIEVTIPLTVAIMRAMVVGVGKHDYAIPVAAIHEVVKPDTQTVHSIAKHPVMRLRDNVLPLVDLRDTLREPKDTGSSGFAVVVGVGTEKAGLIVDRLIGQQEVVIKPLDDSFTRGGPFSGATIREDGNASLILDVVTLVRSAAGAESPAPTPVPPPQRNRQAQPA